MSNELDKSPSRSNQRSCPPSLASRFDDFWRIYPRRESKMAAQSSWVRQRLDAAAEEILEDIAARIADQFQWRDPQFIPLAATYLNQKRWMDEWKRTPRAGQISRDSRSADELEAANRRELDKFGLGEAA